MEKRTIRSGAPFVTAGAGVLLAALVLGLGSLLSYVVAAAAGVIGFSLGKKAFPVREIEVQRAPRSGSAEVDALICEARAQLEEIIRANDAIAEPALSGQIDDIVHTCRLILARLEEQPHMHATLRTFLRYYLPATLGLLQERAKLEHEVSEGRGAQIADQIRTAMAQVQQALHKQLEAMNEYRFINLESEMDVLRDMLEGDGLLARTDEDAQNGDAPSAAQGEAQADPFASLFAQEER